MAEQMTARRVHVDGHIRLLATQRARARNARDVFAKGRRVKGIAQLVQGGQQRKRRFIEAVEVGEVAGLVDAVDVGFLGCEGEVSLDLGADGPEQCWVDEV